MARGRWALPLCEAPLGLLTGKVGLRHGYRPRSSVKLGFSGVRKVQIQVQGPGMRLGKSSSHSQMILLALPVPACLPFLIMTNGITSSLSGPPELWASAARGRGNETSPLPHGPSGAPLPLPTPPQGLSYLMSESQAGSYHCELCCDSQADSFTTNTLKAPGTGAPGCGTTQEEKLSLPFFSQNPSPSPSSPRGLFHRH